MSITLQNLRRSIGRRIHQPYARKFGVMYGTGSASGSTTTLIDTTRLKEVDNYWKGTFIYFPATQVVREIESFAQSSSTLTWLAPIAAGTTSSTIYELWSLITPIEIHDAANQALRNAWPWFFEIGEEYLVAITNDGSGYSLSSLLSYPVRFLAQVHNEMLISTSTGTVTSAGAQNVLIDSRASFDSADVGKTIRIYDGTSAGNRRTISAVNSTTQITVSVNFTATLDTTSKYLMADETEEGRGFTPRVGWEVNQPDNPARLWLGSHGWSYDGYLMRLRYAYEFPALSAETDATTCPQEFVEAATLARIYQVLLSRGHATEVPHWDAMYNLMAKTAEAYARTNKYHHLPADITNLDATNMLVSPEYPF